MAGRSAVMAVSKASARRQASTALASLLGTHTAATLGSGGQPTGAAAAANAFAVTAAAVAANDAGVSLQPEQLASRLLGFCAPVASSCVSSSSTASCLSSTDALRSSSGGCSSAGGVASSGRTAGQQWGASASAHTQTQMRRGIHGLARAGGGSVGTPNVLTRPVSPTSTSASPASRLVPVRLLNVHEYQGAALMAKYGVNVPKCAVASTPAEAAKAAKELAPLSDDGKVVVKAQVLAGGRGLGTFKNGFKGGVHIVPADEIEGIAGKMLGQVLVTKQTGEEGKPVNKVLVAERLTVVNEMYFAILLDRASAGPVMIACQYGGTSIEDLAEKYPDLIIKVPVNAREGITQAQAEKVVEGLAPKVADKSAAAEQIKRMYDMFWTSDCTLLEVNPLVETASNEMVAADAKINFDDNAAFRQKEIFALRDHSQEDPREVAAAAADLNYIGLSGEIGCMVNGAGLAMATMDIIKLHGSSPANFLDVGGSASEQQVVEAFKILTSDSKVKAILVNIFGGIMKCDVIASGIVNAAKTVSLNVPLVVRLEGTNVETGKKILTESGLPIITAEDLDDAAIKAVKAVQG